MEHNICGDCEFSNTHRVNEQGQVRCTRFSRFVNLNDKSCEAFLKGDCGCFFDGKEYREEH